MSQYWRIRSLLTGQEFPQKYANKDAAQVEITMACARMKDLSPDTLDIVEHGDEETPTQFLETCDNCGKELEHE